jgi:hypothetical protein
MADTCLFLGWRKPVEGRQKAAVELFGVFTGYIDQQVKAGALESFEPVLLVPHGGDLNGYIVMRGDAKQIEALKRQARFEELTTQASICLENYGLVEGRVGAGLEHQMQLFAKFT